MSAGKCQVIAVSYDSLPTASGAAAAANVLASQNVHATVGPIPSPEVTAFKPAAKRCGIVNFSSAFAADAITPEFPLAFHKVSGPQVWGATLAATARKLVHISKVIVVGPNHQGGTDVGTVEAKPCEAAGISASTEWYQRGTVYFSPIVAHLRGMSPDAIEMGPMPPQ